mmetsp:Transcript_158947/g.293217  ORF Transcript_158947/g.293217 Transcript_158947/m.293217 type:complete len:82 (-) Transcript_158947:391-636(-)
MRSLSGQQLGDQPAPQMLLLLLLLASLVLRVLAAAASLLRLLATSEAQALGADSAHEQGPAKVEAREQSPDCSSRSEALPA